MGGHSSEYHFQFFSMYINKVTQNRIPVQIYGVWTIFQPHIAILGIQRYQTFFLETAGEKVLRGWIPPPQVR